MAVRPPALISDFITLSPISISHDHAKTHEGIRYVYSEISNIGNSETREILIETVLNGPRCHFDYAISVTKECTVELFEDVVTSDDGTEVTVYNRNRNSERDTLTNVFHTPTVTDDGTRLEVEIIKPGGAAGLGVSAFSRSDGREFILKGDTKYLVRITSNASDNDVNVLLDWYEQELIA